MPKQKSILVLVVVLSCAGLCFGKYNGGDGSPQNPYKIATAEDLNDIGNHPEDFNKCFLMVNDINLADYTGTQFNIIGSESIPFTGVFDGNGHTISNFTYTTTDTNCIGLFGYVYNPSAGIIKDLTLIDPNVNAGTGYYVGSLVGCLENETIVGCGVQSGSVSGNDCVGGLVGNNCYGGMIIDCYATASVSGDDDIGGLVGQNYGAMGVFRCYATGSVSGDWYVGGLVGGNYSCYRWGISDCYATGSVSGKYYTGGLVGANGTGWGPDPPGSTISNCYATGAVTGDEETGGLVGSDCGYKCMIITSFWDVNTTGQSTSDGGIPKTTAEMQTRSTFTDASWDFGGIWDICEGTNYPRFVWQIPLGDLLCPDGVNFIDYSFFAGRWMDVNCPDSNDCDGCDLDFSDAVDANDLKIFCDHWLQSID